MLVGFVGGDGIMVRGPSFARSCPVAYCPPIPQPHEAPREIQAQDKDTLRMSNEQTAHSAASWGSAGNPGAESWEKDRDLKGLFFPP